MVIECLKYSLYLHKTPVSRKALDEFPADNVISLPSWENVAAASIRPMYEPLAMAGFLGDSNADETADEEIEEDNE